MLHFCEIEGGGVEGVKIGAVFWYCKMGGRLGGCMGVWGVDMYISMDSPQCEEHFGNMTANKIHKIYTNKSKSTQI